MAWNVKAMTGPSSNGSWAMSIWRPAAAKIGVQEEDKHEREGINQYIEQKAMASSSSP
jgi:hypothetical protein